MKNKIVTILLVLSIGSAFKNVSAQNTEVSFQVFYDELSPYGTWVNNSDYGYVWVPDVAAGFTPYATNGYWIYTEEGWTWVSAYPWGWAPFHYGRWYTDPFYGPMWVPDTEWGPGWVSWRRSAGYYGWAPIAPGISISIAYSNEYQVPNNHWTFIRERNFGKRNSNNYYVNPSNNVTIIHNSTVINNIRDDRGRNIKYNAGPDRRDVEKFGGRTITPILIKSNNKPGEHIGKDQLDIYRPEIKKNNTSDIKPTPKQVRELKDVKPPNERGEKALPQKENQPTKKPLAKPQQKRTPTDEKINPNGNPIIQPKSNKQIYEQPMEPIKHPVQNKKETVPPTRNATNPKEQPNQDKIENNPAPQNTSPRPQQMPRQQREKQQRQGPITQPNQNTEPPHQQPNEPNQNNQQRRPNNSKRDR